MDGMSKGLKSLLILITGMIIGLTLGVLVINTLLSYRIDKYHERISYLENVIIEKDTKLTKLEESVNKKKYILKDIEIKLINAGDRIEKMALEKHIKEKYSKLIGKEVKGMDTDMLVEVIDKRIMIVNNHRYRLKLTRLVLTETLSLWIEAREE